MEEEQRRIYRRRKKWQGATWTPERQAAAIQDGAYCRLHKTWHGYMSMGLAYEKRGEQFWMLWSCPISGNVIQEMPLGEKWPSTS